MIYGLNEELFRKMRMEKKKKNVPGKTTLLSRTLILIFGQPFARLSGRNSIMKHVDGVV